MAIEAIIAMTTYGEFKILVAKRIAALRVRKGISPEILSRAVGRGKNYIYQIERGDVFISIEGIFEICEYFEISLTEFLSLDIAYPELLHQLVDTSKQLTEPHLKLLNEVAKTFRSAQK